MCEDRTADDPSLHVLQGPRMVRDVFRLAKENAPAIILSGSGHSHTQALISGSQSQITDYNLHVPCVKLVTPGCGAGPAHGQGRVQASKGECPRHHLH